MAADNIWLCDLPSVFTGWGFGYLQKPKAPFQKGLWRATGWGGARPQSFQDVSWTLPDTQVRKL